MKEAAEMCGEALKVLDDFGAFVTDDTTVQFDDRAHDDYAQDDYDDDDAQGSRPLLTV